MQNSVLHKKISCCLHCNSEDFSEVGKTTLGYVAYRCSDCNRKFNERTDTPFNFLEQRTDVLIDQTKRRDITSQAKVPNYYSDLRVIAVVS